MRAALALVFFLSGCAALLFESLWFRQTLLAFGSSVWASSLVLSAFMAGLALGNAGAARWGRRVRSPVRLYAVLELCIGALGVLLVWLLPRLGALLAPVFGPLLEVDAIVQPLRFLFAFGLLAAPAAAMGATLPLLVRALTRSHEDFGSTLGFLYGWNTLGAVGGALAGELFLVERLGVLGSAGVAAGLNVLAAAGALALAFGLSAPQDAPAPSPEAPPERISGRARRLLAAAFLSGGLLLALQVVWFRLLVLFVAGTSRAFAVMLAVVLAGIALGGLLAGAWMRRSPGAERYASGVALLAGCAGLLGYAQLGAGIEPSEFNRVVVLSRPGLVLAVVLMFPTALASGAFFTLAGKQLNDTLLVPVRSAGWLTLVNTVGSAIGPVVAGFLLLPLAGVELSTFLLCAAYAVVALLVFRWEPVRRAAPVLAMAIAFGTALLLFPFGRMSDRYLAFVVEKGLLPGAEVVVTREGLTETIQLARLDAFGRPVAWQLMTDGYAMSSSLTRARRYMELFAYLPAALHPGPEDALVISYGVGNTARALTRLPELRSLDVVDISRDILEMADLIFAPPEQSPLQDPRVQVHVEDGRYFLQTTPRRFDLITGEPPPPNLGHVAYLYTQEYFQLAYDRLREGGLVSYWLPMDQLQISEGASVIGAFCAVFEDCSLWNGGSLNWILLGSRGGIAPVDEASLGRLWRNPETAEDLRSIAVETPATLGALFVADATQLRELSLLAPPVRDDFPLRIHNWASPPQVRPALTFQDTETTRKRFASSRWLRERWPESLWRESARNFRVTEWVERVTGLVRRSDAATRRQMLRHALEDTRLEVVPLLLLGSDPQVVAAARAAEGPATPARDRVLGHDALSRRDFATAARHYQAALADEARDEPGRDFVAGLASYARCRAARPGPDPGDCWDGAWRVDERSADPLSPSS